MNSYPTQTLVQVNGNFYAVEGTVPTDPTTVTMTLTAPDDTINSHTYPGDPSITRLGIGEYAYQFVVTQMGVWMYRWQGEGAVIAGSQNCFLRGI